MHVLIYVGKGFTPFVYVRLSVCLCATDPMQSEVYNRYLSLMEHVQQLAELGLPNALATGGTSVPYSDSHTCRTHHC